ncbi:MAG: preprotein translocase subunit SecA, partial [Candidatus Liptonbacteria bacterium]|nr:preprotein translocase subunit SecA [Candidatus Liptonbacteria bacterium]
VKEESRTYGKISIQNYFRMYEKIAGMTGTATTSAEEFHKVYHLDAVVIPTNKPLIRMNLPDAIYKNWKAKLDAIAKEVKARHEKGQPVLVGTPSIEKNELVSAWLAKAGVPHEVLNAKHNEREGAVIAQAGRRKAVTVATNIAGRGVDIVLGGNPPDPREAEEVRKSGGLHVIGAERHEARRIDNQLRGRAGRQGDPGSSQFFLSLQDDLLRVFGGERIQKLMETFHLPEDQPIDMALVSKAVEQAQARVEGANFDMRKHLLEYDDVLNKQRANVYARRGKMLAMETPEEVARAVFEAAESQLGILERGFTARGEGEGTGAAEELARIFGETGIANKEHEFPQDAAPERMRALLLARSEEAGRDPMTVRRMLGILDFLWMAHLENLEALQESIGLRAYGQRDPLVEYRREAHRLFRNFWSDFNAWIFSNLFRMLQSANEQQAAVQGARRKTAVIVTNDKIGRNDPCPCGAVNPATGQVYKYKKCGLINAPHHRK